ncbi:hypothetical protein ACLMAB_21355 [Brevibacillus laterosporus]
MLVWGNSDPLVKCECTSYREAQPKKEDIEFSQKLLVTKIYLEDHSSYSTKDFEKQIKVFLKLFLSVEKHPS